MRAQLSLGLLLVMVACGKPTVPPDKDAGPADSGTPDAGPTDSGTTDGGSGVGVPTLSSVTLVTHGTHEATWVLPAAGCTYVGLSLKVGSGSYSEVKVVPGTATTTQYMPGHASDTYCYTVACTLNNVASGASNELCVTQ